MGYRSDVGLVVRRNKDVTTTISELLALVKVAGYDIEDWKGYDARLEWDDDTLIFHVEDFKWYETYPEVQCVEKLKELALETNEFSYSFARVGEETDDNEYLAEGEDPPYEALGIARYVCVDASIKAKGE
jgi:hypothetical protein